MLLNSKMIESNKIIPNRGLFDKSLKSLILKINVKESLKNLMKLKPIPELLIITDAVQIMKKIGKLGKENCRTYAFTLVKKWKGIIKNYYKENQQEVEFLDKGRPNRYETFTMPNSFPRNVCGSNVCSVVFRRSLTPTVELRKIAEMPNHMTIKKIDAFHVKNNDFIWAQL
uniref:TFIIS N-terminal domain-containing protein n=1 Tax=Rhabditophanes sp. KR3021 TaxID=114890 RepID=A0AC35U1B5_9BILA